MKAHRRDDWRAPTLCGQVWICMDHFLYKAKVAHGTKFHSRGTLKAPTRWENKATQYPQAKATNCARSHSNTNCTTPEIERERAEKDFATLQIQDRGLALMTDFDRKFQIKFGRCRLYKISRQIECKNKSLPLNQTRAYLWIKLLTSILTSTWSSQSKLKDDTAFFKLWLHTIFGSWKMVIPLMLNVWALKYCFSDFPTKIRLSPVIWDLRLHFIPKCD